MSRTFASALTLAVVCVSIGAHAYVPTGGKWKKLPVTYRINESTIPASIAQVGKSAVEAGFATWSAPMCTNFKAQNLGNTNASFNGNDQQNTILWRSGSWPASLGDVDSTIGITLTTFSGSTHIDSDIVFNNVGFKWNTTGTGGGVDVQSIATHEQGHFLGLDHTPILAAVMFASYNGGLKRVLHTDDINGVCALYPCSGSDCGSAGTGGSSGAGGSSGGSGGASGTAGGSAGTCNPVTNAGCEPGEACDLSNPTGYECYPPPNNRKLCQSCGQTQGYCEGGLTCVGICVKFCCDDSDCGSGQCDTELVDTGSPVGICVKVKGQGQNAQAQCSVPNPSPSGGKCLEGGSGGASHGQGGASQGTGGASQGKGGASPGAGGASQGTGGVSQGTGPGTTGPGVGGWPDEVGAGGHAANPADPEPDGGAPVADSEPAGTSASCKCDLRPTLGASTTLLPGLAALWVLRRRRHRA